MVAMGVLVPLWFNLSLTGAGFAGLTACRTWPKSTARQAREVLNKSGSMRPQWKMGEFKAKIASHSAAMAKIFNAEIVHFPCGIAEHGLFSASLAWTIHESA